MNQSDIVLTPVSKGPKNITWRKVLAMVLLLACVIALVVTLILLLQKDETPTNEIPSTTECTIAETLPLDCKDLYMNGLRKSGVYTIYPWERSDPNCRPLQAYCDMETEGGGWTAIQRRVNGEESFNRNWTEYKLGFGTPYGGYWIGNDAIRQLTFGRNSSLRVTITPMDGGVVSSRMYHQFYIDGEDQNYRLQIANPGSGNIPSINLMGNPQQFSTFDADNDGCSCNCAAKYFGGWWFGGCHSAFLNGLWHSEDWGSPWYPPYGNGSQVNGTSMLIKSY